MPEIELTATAQQWAHELLTWIGFGTLVGLVAKAIMPGRDPGGAIATLLMGIGGSIIGGGVLLYFRGGEKITPISPIGFFVATGGAFVLLFFYRLLSGRLFVEGNTKSHRRRVYRQYPSREPVEVIHHDE